MTGLNGASEREKIEMLLPWYATGRLDARDRQRVEAYLAEHPEMRARLRLSVAERNETRYLNTPGAAPSPDTVDRFMAEIARRKAADGGRQMAASWIDGGVSRARAALFDMFFPPSGVQWGRIAAGALILVQAAVITLMLAARPGGQYEVAGGPSQLPAGGTYAHVRFVDNAPVSKVAGAMSELGMTIAGGPKAGGFFLVRIGPDAMSENDRNRAMSALKGRSDIIALVTIVR